MPKRLGEWLPVLCAGFIVLLAVAADTLVAGFGFFGSLLFGLRRGFDVSIILAISIFGFLFLAEIVNAFWVFSKQRYLKSVWPNVFEVVVRLVWVGIASFFLYSLFGAGIFKDYPKGHIVILCTAIALLLGNVPFLIFHASLCFKKVRDGFLASQEYLENCAKAGGTDAPKSVS